MSQRKKRDESANAIGRGCASPASKKSAAGQASQPTASTKARAYEATRQRRRRKLDALMLRSMLDRHYEGNGTHRKLFTLNGGRTTAILKLRRLCVPLTLRSLVCGALTMTAPHHDAFASSSSPTSFLFHCNSSALHPPSSTSGPSLEIWVSRLVSRSLLALGRCEALNECQVLGSASWLVARASLSSQLECPKEG